MRILTFDIEEWFHVLDHESIKSEKSWHDCQYRIDANLEAILELLDKYDQKATFFCLGWIAEKYPHIIKRLHAFGYEVATHSHLHQLVYEQRIEEFESDLERSIKSLEDLTGRKVRAYRAPGFSVKEENRWVFDSLIKHGIEIDCSIFPAKREHGGFKKFGKASPVLIQSNSGTIKEFPISLSRLSNKDIIYSGGGYFRLLPYKIIHYFTRRTDYLMTYFHPHDFDADRPLLDDLSNMRKFKASVGLKSALGKLEKYIVDFDFVDLDEAVRQIDWSRVDVIDLKERRKKQRLCSVIAKESRLGKPVIPITK